MLVTKKKFCPNSNIEIDTRTLREFILDCKEQEFTFVSLEDYHSYRMEDKVIAITLDDGYKNNLINAGKLFEELEVPYTVFVAVDFIRTNYFAWWYALEACCEQKNIEISSLGINVSNPNRFERYAIFDSLRRTLHKSTQLKLEFEKECIEKGINSKEGYLTKNDVVRIHKSRFGSVQSHGISHTRLIQKSEKEVLKELTESKKYLETLIEDEVRHFAIPYGKCNDFNGSICSSEDYDYLYSTESYMIGSIIPRLNFSYDEAKRYTFNNNRKL
ncbi:polysaccharide deacetylase domain protein [Vibrio ishigakensis]|uniref:Polysaccharide deacetylase domain protein n=1 Tax=Vibrio ishigakensis TaxID=1481914 RepID=A0A0B8PKX8_9VIBR|nr:polysaccharide deacetylase domain protein [Vibrio ishigakensis]